MKMYIFAETLGLAGALLLLEGSHRRDVATDP